MTPAKLPPPVGSAADRRVLHAVRVRGPGSRADLARHTGLSAPTVSKAVAALLDAGLLAEAPPAAGVARGRPAPVVSLAADRAQVLGVVIDAGDCTVVAAGLDGVLRGPRAVPTAADYAALLDALEAACVAEMARPGVVTLGVGVSLPGLLDVRRGAGVLSPNVPVTDGHTPAADLAARLGRDCVVLQESHALCLAEQHAGPARGMDDFLVVDTSTGVGLAAMAGGRLLTGHAGLAGELGHVTVVPAGGRACGCGNTGCLETVASDTAVFAQVAARVGRPVTAADVRELAAAGPVPELAAAAAALALGLAAVVNLFNPATVFLHGRLPDCDPAFLDTLRTLTARRALPPSLADCTVRRAAGTKALGAVAGILDHLTGPG